MDVDPAARPAGGLVVRAHLVALAAFLVLDALWITLVATRLYDARMPALVREDPRWVPAVLFYAGFVTVLVHLAVLPALTQQSVDRPVVRAATTGAVLGLTAYGTYALTALAVLEGFSTLVAVADLVWGGVLGAAVAATTAAVLRRRAGRRR